MAYMSIETITVANFSLGLGKDARDERVLKVHVHSQKVKCRNEEVTKCLRSRKVSPLEVISPSASSIIR
jgi:hypothetical protein